ncbi:MAG: hypothetical protein ACO1OB_32440 [Archangium sp.]
MADGFVIFIGWRGRQQLEQQQLPDHGCVRMFGTQEVAVRWSVLPVDDWQGLRMRLTANAKATLWVAALIPASLVAPSSPDIWLSFKAQRAVDRHVDVAAIGGASERIGGPFKCPRAWTCDACVKLEKERAADERVFIVSSLWRMFYVRVGTDDRVREPT